MELSGLNIIELISLYGQTIKEMKSRGILRTKNVVGELGAYYVYDIYNRSSELPTLTSLPIGTKNVNAISQNGQRYCIKSMSGNVSGAFYGLEPRNSSRQDSPLFEFLILCKLSEAYELENIYEMTWDSFQKHKKWNARMNAWNITLTKTVISDCKCVLSDNKNTITITSQKSNPTIKSSKDCITNPNAISWEKTNKINHKDVKIAALKRIEHKFNLTLSKQSESRYVDSDADIAIFIMSASYSQKNGEYWYSINDENFPWMELYSECYVAFVLGSSNHVLIFPLKALQEIMKGCLRTSDDESKNKKAHYHFSFGVDGEVVYFKQKLPHRDFINISDRLL